MRSCPAPRLPAAWRWSVAALVLALQACGGGGDGGAAATAPAPAPAPAPAAETPTPSIGAPAPAPAPAAPSPIQLDAATSCSIPGMREQVLQQVNRARADGHVCGTQIFAAAPALEWNELLFSAAARHSTDMAIRNYFAHDTPEGVSFSQRLTAEGYPWRAAAENVAAGQTSVTDVVNGWLASEGHCRNIMNPIYADIGVACVAQTGTMFGSYWSMELGRR